MAKFIDLKNDPANRKVRDVIMSSGETINVYEPTRDQVMEILSFQEKWIKGSDLVISGIELIKIIFPMLTDIEGIEELTNDEIVSVVDNPTIAMVQVQHEIETIITEVYKTVILSTRRDLLETDFQVEAYKASEEAMARSLSLAAKNNKKTEFLDKLKEKAKEFEELDLVAKEEEKENNLIRLNQIKDETQETVHQYEDLMKEYQDIFADDEGKIDDN